MYISLKNCEKTIRRKQAESKKVEISKNDKNEKPNKNHLVTE